jgi:hypothetical protein
MWHFSKLDKRLRYSDNRLIVAGETLTATNEPIKICSYGMHASKCPVDALSYAPGCHVWAVEMGDDVITKGDKSVSKSRKALWGYDVTEVLLEFSRIIALESLENFYDEVTFGKLDPVIRQFLKIGDGKLATEAARAAYIVYADSCHTEAVTAIKAVAFAAYAAEIANDAAKAAYVSYTASYATKAAITLQKETRERHNQLLEKMILAGRP